MIAFPASHQFLSFVLPRLCGLNSRLDFGYLTSIQRKRADGGECGFRPNLISFMKLDPRQPAGYWGCQGKTVVCACFTIFIDGDL